jgi:uncharacterized membrane protein
MEKFEVIFWVVIVSLAASTFLAQVYAFSNPVQDWFYFGWYSWWQLYITCFYSIAAVIFFLRMIYWKPKKPPEEKPGG